MWTLLNCLPFYTISRFFIKSTTWFDSNNKVRVKVNPVKFIYNNLCTACYKQYQIKKSDQNITASTFYKMVEW